ncbi:substrate-binding periplasmic protein [Neptuniibacter halophilus]|uniref:substrate-binding periplasmic protein n=1 Tax=Neptuniibacter halophilus TaxID=651666 RepID=UPI002572C834|nr:transporter substrate-binding domain-containing protein [Neptuniibacter halophilus]
MYKWLITALLVWCASALAGETIQVPTYDQHRPPTAMLIDGEPHGIYPDLLRAILKRAGLQPKLIPVPPLRRRMGFEQNHFSISCCANPAWRQRPQEQEVQIFSQPFYWTRDIFVFPLNQTFPIERLSHLSDKRVATVRGFDYRGEEYFGERIDYHNERALMQALSLSRADVGIINQDIFLAAEENLLLTPGPVHDQASLHIRIHRDRIDLVEPINRAISELIRSGERDRIVNRYLNHIE